MKQRTLIWTLFIIVGLLLSACGGDTAVAPTVVPPTTGPAPTAVPPTAAPQVAQTLKVAASAAITTWDPIKSFSTEALYMGNMYEQLLRINPPSASERFTPLLAEKWEPSADGLSWTFHLRPNVKFHDGEALTADAVKLSIEAAQKGSSDTASFIWAPLKTIEVVDPLTVKMNLKYAAPVDLIASSLYAAWIVSPKALAAVAADEKYFEKGVDAGTGPYMLDTYTPDKGIVLKAFEGYWGGWGGAARFNKIDIQMVDDGAKQQELLDKGEVDLAFQIPLDKVAGYKGKAGFSVVEEPSFFNYVGMFNTTRPPLDNKLVRQALSYAIPYTEIIQTGAQGYGTQSRPVPAGIWPYSERVKQYTQDLTKAKDLLKQAGFEGKPIKLKLTYASENKNEERFVPLIKDAFAKIGVEVEITPMKFGDQWKAAKADPANAQDIFILYYWPTYSDAGTDNLYSMFHSSKKPFFNLSYWVNTDFDTKIDKAAELTVSDPANSAKMYEEAMNLLVDEAPGVFLYDTKAVYAIPDKVKGYQYNLNYPFTQFFYPLHT